MTRSRLLLLLAVIAAIVAFVGLDLGRYLTLDAIKARQADLSAWVDARIEAVAKQHGIDIAGLPIVDAPYSEASAAKAVELVRGSGSGTIAVIATDATVAGVHAAMVEAIGGVRGTALGLDLATIAEVRTMAGRVVEIRLRHPVFFLQP